MHDRELRGHRGDRALGATLAGIVALASIGCGTETSAPPPTERAPSSADMIDPRPRFDGLEGFWSAARAREILDRTERFELRADTSGLTAGEREAIERLRQVGDIVQRIYEESRHPQARAVRTHLEGLAVDPSEAERLDELRTIYRLFSGPIAFTLDGRREPLAPIAPYEPGRNVYPNGVSADALRRWADANPGAGILDARSVVRRRTLENLTLDRGRRDDHPVLEVLHPSLRETLAAGPNRDAFYAVPHALAYAPELLQAYGLLREAAELVRADDADLADYLEQRARDLLTNDYEAGDAAWVSGRFTHLNAEIGAYETYDDHLFGQKAFFALSILIRAPEESAELERAVAHLGELEADLPGGPYEPVRSAIPIGVYDVLADYGQARGANTASVLPNDASVTRKYGRTILIRRNVLRNPAIVASAQRRFRAAVAEAHADDLGDTGNFDRTVWHEVGHYLGPKRTDPSGPGGGRDVSVALGNLHNHFEELKADLVSLWLVPRLIELGVMTPERGRAAYAAGVLRTLVSTEPSRESPYQTMQLMQQRWLFDRRVLRFTDGRLTIDYARYPAAVEAMLTEVLRIQRAGDRAAAEAFVARWAEWDASVQGAIGAAVDAVAPRFWLPDYPAL